MTPDIDQYILFTIYPAAVIFGLGFLAKKARLGEILKYILQGCASIIFSIIYFFTVPDGGAQGLAIVLFMFGVLLLFLARKHFVHPETESHKAHSANSTEES
jgi:heme/copper-type cytochrome/quinol oxidase subunit 4